MKTRDIVVLTRQLSTMINAGIPLVQAMTILAEESQDRVLAGIMRKVVQDVESGSTIADALGKHPQAFSDLYVNMVAAGEAGGVLDTILLRLAIFMEKNDAIVRRVKGALIYPCVIVVVAAIAVGVLLVFVIPVFESLFSSAGMVLPLPTRIVMTASELLKEHWHIMLGVLALFALMLQRYRSTAAGKLNIDRMLLRIPIIGGVFRKSAVSGFTRTLGTLTGSGVNILDGLEITAKTAGNAVVRRAIMESRSSIAGGDTIAAPLSRSRVFPPMVISMISVGEQTGGLDDMLSKIADFYDEEVNAAVSSFLSLLEPVMILVLGFVVGGMVVAMYLPIFDMVNAVQ